MAKMLNTKYGYVTPQEAEMDAHLDKWMKRRAKHEAINEWRTADYKTSLNQQTQTDNKIK